MIRAILLVIAVSAAIAAGWVYSNRPPVPATGEVPVAAATVQLEAFVPPQVEMVAVLGARVDLQAGQTVTADDLLWIDWPAGYVLSHQILQSTMPEAMDRLNGQVAMIAAGAGEPLRADGFAPPAARPISERLAPGMRAVAVRVNLEAAVGGFVLPNDRVDVIHTDTSSTGSGARSMVVVFNARVIAIDQTTRQGTDETIMVARTVTLELDRAGAEAVASAQSTGQLTLALRATADSDEPTAVPLSIAQTLAPGMRAVVLSAVELTPGDAVRQGDRIDLIHTLTSDGAPQPVSTVIASNVRVIAVDPFSEGASGGVARSVTLELDSSGVDALSAARGSGVLSLSLRALADVNEPPQVQFPTVPIPPVAEPEVRVRRGGDL